MYDLWEHTHPYNSKMVENSWGLNDKSKKLPLNRSFMLGYAPSLFYGIRLNALDETIPHLKIKNIILYNKHTFKNEFITLE